MITVIADDLTGAAEIAGVCLRYGIEVSFGIDTIPKKQAQVNIIATDSRSVSEKDAYQIHSEIAEKVLHYSKNQIIFKKCDSVLRGHVLTELTALMKVFNKTKVLLQPSNPFGNRCIHNGIYYVNDEKIESTGFSTDPDFPATTSFVKDLVLNRSSETSLPVYTGIIENTVFKGVYIPDCNSEDDLKESIQLYKEAMLVGGSAAFFEQLLINLKMASNEKTLKTLSFSREYLLVSGSTHPKSIAFAKHLQTKNCPILQFPKVLLQENISESELNNWVEVLTKVYLESNKMGIRISNDILNFKESSKILKDRFSIVVKHLIEASFINDIFIEGGATAYDVLKKLQWTSFTPVLELASGVVRMQYDENPKTHITIKPGSYQWPEGLLI